MRELIEDLRELAVQWCSFGNAGRAKWLTRSADALESQQARIADLAEIETYLIDQRDEPWPGGTESDRLHYWRDKAIEAARRLAVLRKGEGERE